jgi:hypothetical protein
MSKEGCMTNENTSKAVSTGTQQRVRGVPFKPGQSGNPAGRKPGSRNKLVEDFVSDLQEKWRTDGTDILNRVAANEPAKIVEVISRLAPKDIAVKLEERNSLGIDPALWNGFKRVLAAIEECAPSDTNPVEVFDAMERWVRSEFAVPIDGGDGKPLLLPAKDTATEK